MKEFLGTVYSIISAIGNWKVFKKMGREGWEGIIPFYNAYVFFEELYGNGWKFLLFLIPIYNVYLLFKVNIDLAHAFHKSTAFGFGLTFFYPLFICILGFDDSVFRDGSSTNRDKDILDDGVDYVRSKVSGMHTGEKSTADKLRELKRLYDEGILTQEEYETKRKDLIDKI